MNRQTTIYVRKGNKVAERVISISDNLADIPSSVWLDMGYALDGNQVFKFVPAEDLRQEELELIGLFHKHGIEPTFA